MLCFVNVVHIPAGLAAHKHPTTALHSRAEQSRAERWLKPSAVMPSIGAPAASLTGLGREERHFKAKTTLLETHRGKKAPKNKAAGKKKELWTFNL